ncbi:sigma-70 family RNA polymerase sigma factor [Pseudodesulfovibrio thermohalotolerans]|uniref:RNA polymerase sigma factor n=1 Tax=Pseudodesulfovibrio thermohalotolerans TaxID=2880651 RepID=UPI0022BA0629|nr:sigma-70 family RNA polymerase sigma factor [Pseudodesulfovibrio thermohalotolerans]WFS63298.1 sigma-70 family RNA polymerase sigma factor [Pseudodesulfovibrio thermohalotolerans]
MSSTIMEIKKRYDEISYESLFKEHSRLIYKLIINFVKSRNINLHSSEIDDIYQEIALKIFKNDYISRYNAEKSSFITWLNIICRTTAIDYYRKKLRWMEAVLTDAHPHNSEGGLDTTLFSLPAGVLTDRQAEVVTLYFKEGLIACEIARKLGITSRTVRSIKSQALNRLRIHYGASAPLTETDGPRLSERRKAS